MVQLNLSKNSEIKKGKYFKDQTGSKNLRKINIYRWDPSSGENPRSLFNPALTLSPSKMYVLTPMLFNAYSVALAIVDFPDPESPVNQRTLDF